MQQMAQAPVKVFDFDGASGLILVPVGFVKLLDPYDPEGILYEFRRTLTTVRV